jgi:hypothetical protein
MSSSEFLHSVIPIRDISTENCKYKEVWKRVAFKIRAKRVLVNFFMDVKVLKAGFVSDHLISIINYNSLPVDPVVELTYEVKMP